MLLPAPRQAQLLLLAVATFAANVLAYWPQQSQPIYYATVQQQQQQQQYPQYQQQQQQEQQLNSFMGRLAGLPRAAQCAALKRSSFAHAPFVSLYNHIEQSGVSYDLLESNVQKSASHYRRLQRAPSIDLSTFASKFDSSLPTYVLIHGVGSTSWLAKLKDFIMRDRPVNVLQLHWSGVNSVSMNAYLNMLANANATAQLFAEFLQLLSQYKRGRVNFASFHLIGHSLGAHIAGSIGPILVSNGSSTLIGRVTALDPAGACFEGADQRLLSPKSGQLVVALHTDVAKFGLAANVGHVDIYPNGGSRQPGCALPVSFIGGLQNVITARFSPLVHKDVTCSHGAAHKIFTAAYDSLSMRLKDAACMPVAYRCRSWRAFKAGECAGCNDARCHYFGLWEYSDSLRQMAAAAIQDPFAARVQSLLASGSVWTTNNDFVDDNDAVFNGHLIDSDVNNQQQQQQIFEDEDNASAVSRWEYFLRTGKEGSCVYQYRVVIATRRGAYNPYYVNQQQQKRFLYAHIPLTAMYETNDQPLYRLVQLSHKLEAGSLEHRLVAEDLAQSRQSLLTDFNDLLTSYDYYTALVAFESVPSDRCDQLGTSMLSNAELCQPIALPDHVSVWAANGEQLADVSFVALDYLSNPLWQVRQKYSYLFTRFNGDQIESLNNSNLGPSISDLKGRRSLSRNPLKIAKRILSGLPEVIARPVNCLLHRSYGKTRQRQLIDMCRRTHIDLNSSIKLRPPRY